MGLVFAFILSLNYVTARPQAAGETPEITKETKICEEPRDGDSFSLCHFYNWFTDLSNLIRTTGDLWRWGVTWNHLSRVSANILMMLLTTWMTIMRRESEVDMKILDKNQSDFRRFKLKSCKNIIVEQTRLYKPLHIYNFLIQHRGHKRLFQLGL